MELSSAVKLRNGNCSLLTFSHSLSLFLSFSAYLILLPFIIIEKAGTGIVKATKTRDIKPQEVILCDKVIGKHYGGGQYRDTKETMIIYGKRSSHLTPIKDKYYD